MAASTSKTRPWQKLVILLSAVAAMEIVLFPLGVRRWGLPFDLLVAMAAGVAIAYLVAWLLGVRLKWTGWE